MNFAKEQRKDRVTNCKAGFYQKKITKEKGLDLGSALCCVVTGGKRSIF